MRRQTWVPFVLGLALVVGCGGGTSGPLDQGNDSGALCASIGSDGKFTFGLETLVNAGVRPVVIDSVHLVDPSALSIIESRIVTFEDGWARGATLIGMVSGYPPEEVEEWLDSVPAVGTEIPPAGMTGDIFNLVVALQMDPDAVRGTASGVEVRYRDDGTPRTYETTNSIELVHGSCS